MSNRSIEWELAYRKAKAELGSSDFEQQFLNLLIQKIPGHASKKIQIRFHEFRKLIIQARDTELRFLLKKLTNNTGLASFFVIELDTEFRKRFLSEISAILSRSKTPDRNRKSGIVKEERGISDTSRGITSRGTSRGISGGGNVGSIAKPNDNEVVKTGIPHQWPTIPGNTVVDKEKPGKRKDFPLTSIVLQAASFFTFGIVVSRGVLLGASTLVAEEVFEGFLNEAFNTWNENSKNRLRKELEKWKRARGKKIRDDLRATIFGLLNTPIGRIAENMAIRKLRGLSQGVIDLNENESNFPALDLLAGEVPIQVKAFGTYTENTFKYNKRKKFFHIMDSKTIKLSTLQSYATAFEVFLIPNPHPKSLKRLNAGALKLLNVKGLPQNVTDFASCLMWIRNSASLMVPDDHVEPLKKLLLRRLMTKKLAIQGIEGKGEKQRFSLLQELLNRRIRGIGVTSKALRLATNVLLNNDLIKRTALEYLLRESSKPKKRL